MGYSEVVCHLCGVSFNIARLRQVDEPREAAWRSSDWSASEGTFVMSDGYNGGNHCSKETGCCVTFRTERKQKRNVRWEHAEVAFEFLEGYDEDADQSYDYASTAGDEPLEYGSDDESSGINVRDGDTTSLSEDDEEGLVFSDDYLILLRNLDPRAPKITKPEIFHPIETGKELERALWERERGNFEPDVTVEALQEVTLVGAEHVAGPGCKDNRGYNGHYISAEEMKGCCNYQCLAYKELNWVPEPDDQDFELRGRYCLTGIGDRFPSRDMDSPSVVPARHDWDRVNADTYNYTGGGTMNREIAMPFHPTCFDIFTRLSKQHLGCIDIHGLMSWRNLGFRGDPNRNFSQDENVRRATEQMWAHHRRSEYLAANPLYIPALALILCAAVQDDPKFSAQNGAFAIPQVRQSSRRQNTVLQDPFLKLPQELREHIVGYLDSPDIAPLRLASRAFQQLPVSLWYTLLRRETPWLWEVWSDHKPLLWTALEVPWIKAEEKERQEYAKDLERRRNVVKQEMPEILEEWNNGEQGYAGPDAKKEAQKLVETVQMLPRDRTNWYQLYRDITVHWKELRGLWNRERIWRDVEEIVGQIKMLREEGKIED